MRIGISPSGGRILEGTTPYLRFRVVDGVVELWEERDPAQSQDERVSWTEATLRVLHGAAGLVKLTIGADAPPIDVVKARVSICNSCPELTAERRCGSLLRVKTCGCYIDAKAQIAGERCPQGKW